MPSDPRLQKISQLTSLMVKALGLDPEDLERMPEAAQAIRQSVQTLMPLVEGQAPSALDAAQVQNLQEGIAGKQQSRAFKGAREAERIADKGAAVKAAESARSEKSFLRLIGGNTGLRGVLDKESERLGFAPNDIVNNLHDPGIQSHLLDLIARRKKAVGVAEGLADTKRGVVAELASKAAKVAEGAKDVVSSNRSTFLEHVVKEGTLGAKVKFGLSELRGMRGGNALKMLESASGPLMMLLLGWDALKAAGGAARGAAVDAPMTQLGLEAQGAPQSVGDALTEMRAQEVMRRRAAMQTPQLLQMMGNQQLTTPSELTI